MFTGLVEGVGRISQIVAGDADRRVRIDTETAAMADLAAGESIAVDGACLTATAPDPAGFWADVSAETLACTTLGERGVGDAVNLERALLPTTRLGGHLVAGHIDGVGEIAAWAPEGASWRLRIRVPEALAPLIAPKGSIAIDGISLTVNDVADSEFGINIVPHTLAVTNLADRAVGARVNVEIDVIARYVQRLLSAGEGAPSRHSGTD